MKIIFILPIIAFAILSVLFFSNVFTNVNFEKLNHINAAEKTNTTFPNIIKTSSSITTKKSTESLDENLIINPVVTTEKSTESLLKTSQRKIAIVQPTFTEAAYSNHIYDFYHKYDPIPKHTNVTTDLNYLTASLSTYTNVQLKDESDMTTIKSKINEFFPADIVVKINDQDIDQGHLFLNNSKNAFDTLILLHEEYLTQRMYNYYKKFVEQGGTIIFMNGNFFYVQVSYDVKNNSITLVKGHGWEFDGKVATHSVAERWLNDTEYWVGSNYYIVPPKQQIDFLNNIFRYVPHEENYVNNPNDIIILDYHAYVSQEKIQKRVATYLLHSGQGKVIVLGLFAQDLIKNEIFIGFFMSLIQMDNQS